MQNGENMENALRMDDYGKTLLFCIYLHNECLDLVGLSFKFHEDPCANVRAQVINAQTRD